MTIYTGLQSILDAALGEYHSRGFGLAEENDHELTLYYQGRRAGKFSQEGATIPVIRQACQEYLNNRSESKK